MKIALLYIPVIHKGYLDFFNRHKDCDKFYILGNSLIEECDYLRKEIRAITPETALNLVLSTGISNVSILENTKESLKGLNTRENIVIIPEEDVMDFVVETYLFKCQKETDSIFLRWNRKNISKPDQEYFDKEIERSDLLKEASREAEKSSDWWRQVGAILLLSDGVKITAHNTHIPTQHTPYINGDPRNASFKGKDLDIYSSIHAEAAVIAIAAKHGLKTDGASIYVTTFPCPSCLRIILYSGIRTIYFLGGYSILDGIDLIKQYEVTLIKVRNNS